MVESAKRILGHPSSICATVKPSTVELCSYLAVELPCRVFVTIPESRIAFARDVAPRIKGHHVGRRLLVELLRDIWVSVHSEAKAKTAGVTSRDLRPIWFPTLDTLCNFFLSSTGDLLVAIQGLRMFDVKKHGSRIKSLNRLGATCPL